MTSSATLSVDIDFRRRLPARLRQQALLAGVTGALVLGALVAGIATGRQVLRREQVADALQAQAQRQKRANLAALAQTQVPQAYVGVASERIVPTLPLEPALRQLELLAGVADGGVRVKQVSFQAGQPPAALISLGQEDQLPAVMLALCSQPSAGRWEVQRVGPASTLSDLSTEGAAVVATAKSLGGPAALPTRLPPPPASMGIPMALPPLTVPGTSVNLTGLPGGGGTGKPWRAQLVWNPQATCAASTRVG